MRRHLRPLRRIRRRTFELGRSLIEARGFYVLQKRFDLPIPDEEELGNGFFEFESELPGVDVNEQGALRLADVFRPYNEEFRQLFPLHEQPGSRFHLVNGAFMAVDAHVYYALIRHFTPRRIVEVGAGWSTLVAAEASLRNDEPAELIAIDPYPPPFLYEAPGISTVLAEKVQKIDRDVFTALDARDILFIDSSHVLRSGGDVQYEFCEILPRLSDGVFVHVHDVSLPGNYPRVYFDAGLFWNEQYALQTFLAFNSRFEVLWPATYMTRRHPQLVGELFPELKDMRAAYPESEPSSFWMRVKEAREAG